MLNEAEQQGRIEGAAITSGGTRVNHLLLADDCILYSRASLTAWGGIQEIMAGYEKGWGQTLNKQKSSIFLSKATPKKDKLEVTQAIRGFICENYSKYLGLPTFVGWSKYNTFWGLKEKIWQRIHGWEKRFLSQAGCEILIIAVLQSISIFTMSVFQLPKKLCQEINVMMATF